MADLVQFVMTVWTYGFFFVPACLALLLICGCVFDLENRVHSLFMQAAVIFAAGLIAYYAVNLTSGSNQMMTERHYGPFDY